MIAKPPEIVDRDSEWRALEGMWSSPHPELVFVLGRRRAGKSFLLARFAREVGGIYYQATKRTEREQLLRLSSIVGAHFEDPALVRGVPFPDWEALLHYVTERARAEPFLLVLDEFPHLSSSAPALSSILQSVWDHAWAGTRVRLVLSGSHITAMRQLESADQPLYGRRTRRLDIEPFGYAAAAAFGPEYGVRDRLRAYGAFGGLPGHLVLLDPHRSLEENAAAHLLSPTGRLVDEAQHMLDAFLADAELHYSVIEAIAGGEHTWKGITRRVGREGGSLSRALRWLLQMGFVERVVPISEPNPRKSKRARYRITDPYLLFWHRFVSPMVSAGMIGLSSGTQLWREHVEPRLDQHMGAVFEAVCRSFVRHAPELPFRPIRIGQWWDASSTHELDVVALGAGGEALMGECKWGALHRDDVGRLRHRASLAARDLGQPHPVHLALFTTGHVDPDVRVEAEEGRVLLFTGAELYPDR